MTNYYSANILSVLITLTLNAMTTPVYSQSIPASDIISTSAGPVEMDFIGHGSLIFKVNNFVIYIDPVRSSGNYEISQKQTSSLLLMNMEIILIPN